MPLPHRLEYRPYCPTREEEGDIERSLQKGYNRRHTAWLGIDKILEQMLAKIRYKRVESGYVLCLPGCHLKGTHLLLYGIDRPVFFICIYEFERHRSLSFGGSNLQLCTTIGGEVERTSRGGELIKFGIATCRVMECKATLLNLNRVHELGFSHHFVEIEHRVEGIGQLPTDTKLMATLPTSRDKDKKHQASYNMGEASIHILSITYFPFTIIPLPKQRRLSVS